MVAAVDEILAKRVSELIEVAAALGADLVHKENKTPTEKLFCQRISVVVALVLSMDVEEAT